MKQHLVFAVVMVLGGYTAMAAESGSNLPSGAYYRTTVGHVPLSSISSVAALAHANVELQRYVREILGERSECFLVPTPKGLNLEILAHRKIVDAEQLKLIKHIDIALADGKKASATYDGIKTKPNHSPPPNAGGRPFSNDPSSTETPSSFGQRG